MNLDREEDELAFEVAPCELLVGHTYPILGTITKLDDGMPGRIIAKINNHITAVIPVTDQKSIDILKEKAFETGVFVSKVTALLPEIEVECFAVIFGKSPSYHA